MFCSWSASRIWRRLISADEASKEPGCFDTGVISEGSVEGDSPAKDNSEESEREDDKCPPFFISFILASSKKDDGRESRSGEAIVLDRGSRPSPSASCISACICGSA